jgi:predicted enzyme related to lactoylglutathione lyase
MTRLYRKAESAGGKVTVGPMHMMTAGRMAIFAETADAVIAVWQPGQHLGDLSVSGPTG